MSLRTMLPPPMKIRSTAALPYYTLVQLAKYIVLSQLQGIDNGRLIINHVDGTTQVLGKTKITDKAARTVELKIKSSKAWIRILLGNDIGFAEAYMLEELICSDLTTFFRICLDNASSATTVLSRLSASVTAPLHWLSNTSEQALLNAQKHYSLSNELFAAFLDETVTYSAPLWDLELGDADDLASAQIRKLQYTIRAARIKSTDHVLETGTGWGSFAIEAVKLTGCRVTTITASDEQAKWVRSSIEDQGLADKIEVLVCDYRHVETPTGGFDKIVSIEMIEHVGAGLLDTYFSCVDRYLKPEGGIAVFQCITIPEARYAGYCSRSDFIQRYIFHGGHLPTTSGLIASIDRTSQGRLVVEDVKSFSGHYVRALREWREKFERNWEDVIKPALQGARSPPEDVELFRRKWLYYFSYCEAGFASKRLGDVSITVGREGAVELIEDIPK